MFGGISDTGVSKVAEAMDRCLGFKSMGSRPVFNTNAAWDFRLMVGGWGVGR